MSNTNTITPTDENTRLLDDDLEYFTPKQTITPIPKKQLGVIFSIRFTEPIIFSHLYPYINQFVNDIGVTRGDSRNVGFYSGLIESAFALGELCTIFILSTLSDKIGRRPVLLPTVFGLALFTGLFGLSTSFPMMLVLRILAGLLAGSTPIVHSIVGELTDETNNALVVPFYGLVSPIGFAIGPLIGGSLENAATKYPNIFGFNFLRKYPYFLPSLVPALLAITGVVFGYFFLEETLPSKVRAKKEKVDALHRSTSLSSANSSTSSIVYGSTDGHSRGASQVTLVDHSTHHSQQDPEEDSRPKDLKAMLKDPSLRAIMGSGALLVFLYSGFDVLFSLSCFTPIEDGGLGLPPTKIGYAFSTAGFIAMIFQLCITPFVLRAFDKARVYNFCMCSFPFVFGILALLHPIAKMGYDPIEKTVDQRTVGLLYVVIGFLLLVARICVMAFPINMVLVKQTANKNSLGSANGLVQVAMTIARGVCPTVSSSLFALSNKNNILGGYLWVLVMMIISFAGILQSTKISRITKRKQEV